MSLNIVAPSSSVVIAQASPNSEQSIFSHESGRDSKHVSSYAQTLLSDLRAPSPSLMKGDKSIYEAVHDRTESYYSEICRQSGISPSQGSELSFDQMSAWWDAQKWAWADHEEAIKQHHYKGDLPPPSTLQADAEVMKLADREFPKRKDWEREDAMAWAREQYWLRYIHRPERQLKTLLREELPTSL